MGIHQEALILRRSIICILLLSTIIVAGCVGDPDNSGSDADMETDTILENSEIEDDNPESDTPGTENTEAVNSSGKVVEVTIENFKFDPENVRISVGDTIKWTNLDSAPHTATANNEQFDSGTLNKDGTFSFTFEETGTFDYICTIHPYMKANVIVEE